MSKDNLLFHALSNIARFDIEYMTNEFENCFESYDSMIFKIYGKHISELSDDEYIEIQNKCIEIIHSMCLPKDYYALVASIALNISNGYNTVSYTTDLIGRNIILSTTDDEYHYDRIKTLDKNNVYIAIKNDDVYICKKQEK